MTVAHDLMHRRSSTPTPTAGTASLEDRFEVLKDIGDGSFGSVVLARVRSAGSSVARRGTVVSRSISVMLLMTEFNGRTDCNQDDEEELRIVCTMSGAS